MLSDAQIEKTWLAYYGQKLSVEKARGFNFAREIEALVRAEVAAEPNPWRDAVIDGLCASHIYRAEHYADPAKAINELLCWEAKIALDPAVSADARKLQDDARAYPAAVPRGVLEAWERLDTLADSAVYIGYGDELTATAEWKAMAAAVNGAPAEPAPQRQPLSDAQIFAVLIAIDPQTARLPSGFKQFARAIEAAHGIDSAPAAQPGELA